jgi:hypothetical protein
MPAGTFLPPGLTTSDVKITSGGTDNYVMTAVDGETIQGESNLTFDGSTLTLDGDLTFTGPQAISVSSGDLSINGYAGSAIRLNDAQANVDVVIESDSADKLAYFDAGMHAIGFGMEAANDRFIIVNHDEGEMSAAGHVGFLIGTIGSYTTGASFTGSKKGIWASTSVGGSAQVVDNSANWTATAGLQAFYSELIMRNSANTYTVEGAAHYYASNASVGTNVTLTNQYGIYIEDLSSAGTNYQIKLATLSDQANDVGIDMGNNRLVNIGDSGNDFGAAQLDLAAGYTIQGAGDLTIQSNSGNDLRLGDGVGIGEAARADTTLSVLMAKGEFGASTVLGARVEVQGEETGAASTSNIMKGVEIGTRITAANDKNWTAAIGKVGLQIFSVVTSGASGVITGSAGIWIQGANDSTMTTTNNYGIYHLY